MHLTRSKLNRRYPINRRGIKYIARAKSHAHEGVPVVVAVRDMLNLSKTSKEVNYLIQNKQIKINGIIVKDLRESVKIFNILEVGNNFLLKIKTTGRLYFEETKDNTRICKIIKKTNLKGNKFQLNLHDGTNILTKDKLNVGDSVKLDMKNKIIKNIPIEKGRNVYVISGRSVGKKGVIKEVVDKKISISFDEDMGVLLDKSHVIAL